MSRFNSPPPAHRSSYIPPSRPVPAPSFGQTIKEGFGFGIGSAIAHRIVGSAVSMFSQQPTPIPTPVVTFAPTASVVTSLSAEYIQCMKESQNDPEACKQYLN